jgi:hypothetical protein
VPPATPRCGLLAEPRRHGGDPADAFHVIFISHGIEAALEQAREAAGSNDVEIAGGAATVRQYLGPVCWMSWCCTWCLWCSARASACSTT